MLQRKEELSTICILSFFLLSIFFPCIPVSMSEMSLSDSLISVNNAVSQTYIVHDPIVITNDNELAAVANHGTGVVNDPYIIKNWYITGPKIFGNITGSETHGISITGTTKHFKIENCWISGVKWHGIKVYNVANGTALIVNNTCYKNDAMGISLSNSNFSTIIDNICIGNRFAGIHSWESSSSIIANNICYNNNEGGINLSYSDFLTLVNNTCNNNGYDSSPFPKFGVELYICRFSTLASNICGNNSDDGIYLQDSKYNVIFGNILINNGEYGVTLDRKSRNNSIHHNSFFTNGGHYSQTSDNGSNNLWYDMDYLEGNSWSDYSGAGSYLIAGSSSNEVRDLYPFKPDTLPPDIQPPDIQPPDIQPPESEVTNSLTSAFSYVVVFIAFGLFLFIRKHC